MFHYAPGSQFDMLVSNPPYIPSHQLETLELQVKRYEDKAALDGGDDGLKYINYIKNQNWVKKNGKL